MNYEQSNVGPGMVPCKKNCRCNDCTIERLQARARIAEQREAELLSLFPGILELAWRDHKYPEEQKLLEKAEAALAKYNKYKEKENE